MPSRPLIDRALARLGLYRRSELEESEFLEQRLLDAAIVAISVMDANGRFIMANRLAADLVGCSLDELIGHVYTDFLPPGDRSRARAQVERTLVHGEIVRDFETVAVDRLGIHRVLICGLAPIIHHGQVTGAVATAADITEYRQVQEGLKHSEARNRAILQAMPDLVFLQAPDGTYLEYYARDQRDLLVSPGQFLGRRMADVLPPDLVRDFERCFAEALTTGGPAVHEYALIMEHHAEHFEARVVACEGNLLSIVRRITDRKLAEARLHDAEAELAVLSKRGAVAEIVASLTHELSQPLSAILTNAQTCVRWIDQSNPSIPALREALRDVAEDSSRAAALIHRTRELFGKKTGDRETVAVNDVIRHVVRLLHERARSSLLNIELALADDLPHVAAESGQLQQVIMNLTVNAIEALKTAAGPERRVRITSSARSAGEVEVTVHDTGPGVAFEDRDSIFSPFVTTKRHGLGLGLPISRSIVEAYGGRLWVSANDDGGATFHVTIPVVTN